MMKQSQSDLEWSLIKYKKEKDRADQLEKQLGNQMDVSNLIHQIQALKEQLYDHKEQYLEQRDEMEQQMQQLTQTIGKLQTHVQQVDAELISF